MVNFNLSDFMKIVTLKRVIIVTTLLGFLLILILLLSITVGSVRVNPYRSIAILLQSILGSKETGTETERAIILSLRFPRALLAGLVGAGLSVSGAIFQALLRNPLADPYILGVSSGAAVGAIVAIMMGLSTASSGLPLVSFVGALLTIIVVFYFGRQEGKIHPNTLLLAGVIISSFLSALIMFFISISQKEELRTIIFWLMGDFSFSNYHSVRVIFPYVLLGFLFLFFQARPLNLILTGEEGALQMGVDVEKLKIDFLCFGLLDHGCLRLGLRSDRFRGSDRAPFGPADLWTRSPPPHSLFGISRRLFFSSPLTHWQEAFLRPLSYRSA